MGLIPCQSLLCLLHDRPMKPKDNVLKQEKDLYQELADQENGWPAPQHNHLIGVWMPGFSYRSERKKQ